MEFSAPSGSGLAAHLLTTRVSGETLFVSKVVRVIIETCLAPSKTFRDVREILDNDAMNRLRDFSNACREELRRQGSS
jgi:hypothetical protein